MEKKKQNKLQLNNNSKIETFTATTQNVLRVSVAILIFSSILF